MKPSVSKRDTSEDARFQLDTPAGKPQPIPLEARQARIENPGQPGLLRWATLILRRSLAVLLAAGALCLPETGRAGPEGSAFLNAANFTSLGTFNPSGSVTIDVSTGQMSGGMSCQGVSINQAGTPLWVFTFDSFNLASSYSIYIVNGGTGTPAAALLSKNDMSMAGVIYAYGADGTFDSGGTGGPAGGNGGSYPSGDGGGSGGGFCGNPNGYVGGGGGGFGGAGGVGGSYGGGYGYGGVNYGSSDLSIQLQGGSGGGCGGGYYLYGYDETGGGGGGGGAIQLGALGALTLSGFIDASGGQGAGASYGNAGGGSGGGILIYGTTVTMSGDCYVYGGGSLNASSGEGGGGGGGGRVYIAYLNSGSVTGAIDVNGGAASQNAWGSGSAGGAGTFSFVQNSAVPTLIVPPVITNQPSSQAVVVGGNATFSVGASSPMTMTYQWYFDGGAVNGQTSTSYTLSNVSTNNAGSYTVVVTNTGGSTTSSVATLTVFVPPSITTPPISQAVAEGGTVNLSVSPSGMAPLGCQWFENGGMILGATNSALTLMSADVTNSGVYYVVITNAYGMSISQPVTVTVGVPQLFAWGDNGVGELGDGSEVNQSLPEAVASNVVTAAAGADHSLFLKGDGTLYGMGYNADGELGDGTTVTRSNAVSVASNVVAAAAGAWHSLFVTGDGSLWAMGQNYYGQLGDGTTDSRSVPESVASNVVAVAGGHVHSLFLKSDGTLWAMGYNELGQLGDGTTVDRSSAVSVASNVVAVAAGGYHSLFLKSDGTLWAMGYNAFGQLGDGTTVDRSSAVSVASNVVAVAGGYFHSLFLKGDGTLWAMGYNAFGQLGDGTTVDQSSPVSVASNVVAVAAGGYHSLFLKSDGTLWAMGYNGYGQLGDGTTTEPIGPVPVPGMSLADVISGPTSYHTLAVGMGLPPVIASQPTGQTVTVGDDFTFTVAASGFAPLSYQWQLNGANISEATATNDSLIDVMTTNAGSYTVVVSDFYGSVTSSVAVLVVNPATPAVNTWPSAGGIAYPQALSASTLSGGGASVGTNAVAGSFAFTDPAAILDVGINYVPVVFTPTDTTNYNTVNGTVAVTVAQGLVGITALPTAAPIVFLQSLAASTLSGGTATVSGSFSFANSSTVPAGAGTYNAVVLFTATDTNYAVLTTNIAVTVNKAPATVSLSGMNQNYDGTAKSVTVTTTPGGLTVDVTYNGSSAPPTNAGSYTVVATVDDVNYAGTNTGTLLVGQDPLLVAAQNMTNSYGVTNAPFTAAITGFTNGETLSNLSGTLTFTVEDISNNVVSVNTNTPAGTYSIIPSGLSSGNYSITYSNGTLAITGAILTVTADSLTNVYGSPMPPLTWSYQGFVNGEGANVLSGAPSLSTNLSSGSPVAGSPYTITITNGTLSASNYVFTFVDGTFTVLPASLTVSADNATNVYGSPMPALSGSMTGVTNNDPLTVSFTTVATQSSSVGTYNILPLFNEPSLLANYTVTTNIGTFTVTPAPLLVTADNQTRDYGYANPALTLTYNGFVVGDGPGNLVTQPAAATAATPASLVGPYPITVGGGVSSNYTFTYGNGTLTVTKAPLTVVGNNASRPYGAANPVFTATLTGVMNDDNITARFSTSASTNSAPGDYIIQLSLNDPGGKLGQYSTTLNSGILTVSGATLIGAVQDVARAYGQTNPVFTVSYSGFVNGQDSNLLSGNVIFACIDTNGANVDTNTPVGTYPIAVTSGQTAPDYVIQYTNGTLTVTQAVLTVAGNAANRMYGATNPVFTASITGYVNGEDSNVLSGALTMTTAAGLTNPVGAYPIVPSGVSATNYFIDFTNGVLTVTQAPLLVSAGNASRLYGQTNPPFSGTVTGLLNDDNLGITYGTAATPPSPVGNYDIVPAFGDPDNKLGNYLLTASNGTLTVGQTLLSVAADNQTRSYGQSNPTLTGTLTGVVNGDNITASYSTTAMPASPVGPYSIVPSLNDPQGKLPNYTVSSTNGTLTVTTASLVVTADDQTRVYGATNPTFTVTFSGFANEETSSVLGGTLSVTSPAAATSPVGTYAIIPGGLSDSNYSITYANGTLTVTKATLTVTANPATRAYGATNPVFTAAFSGFVNGDNTNVISGQPALSTSAVSSSPVGTYGIATALGNLSALNYTFSFNSGILTITPASLTGTAQNVERAYGQTNPVFTVSYSGFVNGQDSSVVTGTLAFTCLDSNSVPVDTNTVVGVYPIHVITPQTAPNYSIGYVDGTLAVTQAVLTVSADPKSRLYGTTNPVLTVTYSGFVNGEGANVISGQPGLSTVASLASPVGAYDIVVGPGSLSATNYSFSLTNGILTVGKALLTVTADNQSRLYGQTNPVFTVSYSGFVDNDTQSVLSGAAALSTIAGTNSPVGNYDIVVTNGNLTATNYALSFVNGTLTIGPAPLSITAHDATRQYGATNPVFTVTMLGFVNGQDATALAGTLSVTTSADQTSSVGTYDIVPSGLSSTNYALSCTNGTLTVTQAPLTATANNTNRIYGQANPPLTGTESGTLNGDDLGISFVTTATSSSPAGQYAILPVFADPANKLGNYLVTTNSGTLTVSPALLTVTANNQTRAYGQPNPALTLSYSGFASGDDPAALAVQPAASTAAGPASFIGPYTITAAGGVSSNYTFNYVAGTLTVTQADLTIIGDNAARAYGQTNPVFTSTITGVANGDNLTVSYETVATTASPPGGYEIVLEINDPDSKLGEYNLTLVSGLLTVTNAALIVTVDNQNRLYGQTNPPFTAHYNGFVNGQGTNVLNGTLTFACRGLSNAPVGTNTAVGSYPITAAGLTASNYTLQFVPGTLAIAAAPLTITGTSAQRVYGAANPVFTATFSGFVNGQTSSALGGTLSVTSPAVATSPAGTYAIIPGGLTSGNYSLSFVNGTLTITPASLSGAVQNVERAYGQTNPVFTVSYSGFVNGQDSSVVTGTLVFTCLDSNSVPVDTNTVVGVYPIHVITPQTAPNYNIGYVDGTLAVTQAVLTVSADPKSRLYGTTNPVLTVTYSGFVNGEGANVISGQPGLSTVASLASPVGAYDIVVGPGSLSATNYSFSLTNGILTVGKALLTVTADNQSRLYGQTNPVFTVSYSGFVDNDTQSVLSGAAALSTIAGTNSPVGNYDIVVTNGNLTATNYALSFVNGTLTIGPAPLSITAHDATRQYGATNPVFTVTMLGFVNGQDATALAGTLSVTTSADQTSSVGTYDIVPSGLSSTNYALSCTNGTLTVTQAPLTVTANSAVRQYGTTNPVFGGTIIGLLNGDPITANYNCGATQSSPAGSYAIVPSLNDPEDKAPNYAVAIQNGTLTITVAVIPTPAPVLYVVGSPPVFIDTNASVADGGGLNFNGASLSMTIITNANPDDELGLEPQGNGAGQIGVQATNVTYGGTPFAAFSGGDDLNPLVFLFNTNANAQSVTALMRRLTFATESTNTNYCVIQAALTVGGNTVLAQYVFTLDRPPVAGDAVITAAQGETIQILFSQVLTNVYDADGNPLTITDSSVVSANGGWVSTNDVSFTYTPPAGLTGQDRFAYVVEDGRGGDCVGIVIIHFMPKNVLSINTCNLGTTGAELTMAGVPGQVYQIQASTNLVNWITLNTVTADSTGIIQILDAAASNYPKRFYRAIGQ
jgi:alpha-tubulin suppressor-like RCC1 family protein